MVAKDPKPHTSKKESRSTRALSNSECSEETQANKRQPRDKPYSISEEELPSPLKEQLNHLEAFWISSQNIQRREKPIRPKTYRTYKNHILSFLGWLVYFQTLDPKGIELKHLANQSLLADFLAWGLKDRDNSHGWALNVAQAIMLIVTWLYSSGQNENLHEIPNIEEFRHYVSSLRRQYKAELKSKKVERASSQAQDGIELTDELCQKIVEYLRQDCTYSNGRSEIALLRSWQRYLVTGILMFCRPVRLQTLCQLKPSHDLLREDDGSWTILTMTQHKTGYSGVPVRVELPEMLSSDLTTWIDKWRPRIKTENNFAFTKLGSNRLPDALGQPLTERDAWEIVVRASEKATLAILGTSIRISPRMLRQSHIPLFAEQVGICDQGLSSPQNSKRITFTCMPCSTLVSSSIQQQDTKQIAKFFQDLGVALENYNPTQTLTDLIQQIEPGSGLSTSNSLRIAKHLESILHILEKKIPTK